MTDTEAKRRSALGLGRPGAVLPTPDGTIDASDRAALAGAYSGFTYDGPPLGRRMQRERHARLVPSR